MSYCIQGDRPPHLPAIFEFDRDTVEVFRSELNSQRIEIMFAPQEQRRGTGIAQDRQHWSWYPGRYGCWQVIVPANTYDQDTLGGTMMGWTIPVPHVIYTCDGRGGMPLVPGRWLIGILMSRDRGAHGTRQLAVKADALVKDNFLAAHAAGDKSVVEKWRDDPNLYRMLRKRGQELTGHSSFTKEEGIAAESAAARELEAIAARQAKQAQNQTVWQGSTPEV